MKTRKYIILIVVALLAVGGVFFVKEKKQDTAINNNASAVYYCPMHPTYTSDKPGDCPICNMNLVKREETSGKSPSQKTGQTAADICFTHDCSMMKPGEKCGMMVVAKVGEVVSCPVCGTYVAQEGLTLKKVLFWTDPMIPGYQSDKPGKSPMGMDLVPVYDESGHEANAHTATPSGYAEILLSPQKLQLIGVRTQKIEKRAISKTIRTVGKIAYDPDLYQAEQEYISSARALREAEKSASPEAVSDAKGLVESSAMRLQLRGLSKELIDEVALWDGPDKSLLLADPNGKAWVYAPIYEYELPFVKVGQVVNVELSADPGKTLSGTIKSIDSVLDPASRTARARATLIDPEKRLKPEMFVNVSISVNSPRVNAMPEEAVFNTGLKQIVFVDKGEGLFEPRDVKVGFKADGFYELIEGVSEGESVVTSGNFLIDSESRLKGALQGMSEGNTHQHGQ